MKWHDVNIETGEIQVRQQLQKVGKRLVLAELKTAKGCRALALPQTCITALQGTAHASDRNT